MRKNTTARSITRRDALWGLGAALAALPLAQVLGCETGDDDLGDGDPELLDDADTDANADASASSSGAESGVDASASSTADATTDAASSWATGGTAAMFAKAYYPDPFASPSATACELACETTIGPCHTSSPERSDVSDGWNGLPMRLSLRVVDESCTPVEGALVEIWHTNYKGIYSGRINQMCNKDEVDRAAGFFRGYLRTDADGRVDFDSTFPGWYSGRAVHVHLRVLKGSYDGADSASAWVITQLLFADTLIQQVFGGEPLYKTFGQPNTLLSTDNVVGGESDKMPYLFDVKKMEDGAMQASKTLVLRSSLDLVSCSAQGAGGMGGPGGMPPGG